jgi:hypothetical protein
MKAPLIRMTRAWSLIACLLLPIGCAAQQYVELTAELDFDGWDWWQFTDKINKYPGSDAAPSIFHKPDTFRCVIGTNCWLIERQSGDWRVRYWFTGTNVFEQSMATNTSSAIHSSESLDGNPGRPVGVADLLTFDCPSRICWLAFCSGAALRRDRTQIFPPSDFWKETRTAYSGWSPDVAVYDDGLGLPKRISLITTNGQPIMRYQCRQSTNVLGWSFPLEFYIVQYTASGTNEWDVQLTAKGKLTGIGVGAKPEMLNSVKSADRR